MTGSGTTYNVVVSGMTADGTVIADIAADIAHDAAGNGNTASTSTDNTVTYDTTPPVGSITINGDAPYTNTVNVTLNLSATDANGVNAYRVANGTDASGGTIVPITPTTNYAENIPWTLPAGDGTKTVWFLV